jgi:putative MATE family efflux protein
MRPDPVAVSAARREVLATAWPVVLQQTLRTLMFFVDTAMLGFYGAGALATMNIVGPLVWTVVMVLGAVGVGAVATVARAWGEGDRAKAEGEAATALAAALAIGLVASAAAFLAIPLGVDALGVRSGGAADARIAADATAYLRMVALTFPLMLFDIAGTSVLRACGDTRTPFLISAAGNLLNVAGNYAFIFGRWGAPEMGVLGSGLATSVAIAGQGVATAAVLFSGRACVRIGTSAFRGIARDSVARLLRVTLPAAAEPLVVQAGFLVFTRFVNALGAEAAAAHRVAITVESLSFMPGAGFSIACAALVGQRLGARDPAGASLRVRESLRLSIAVMGALGILFAAAPALLVKLFVDAGTSSGAALAPLAALCLTIGAFEQPALGTAMTLQGALRGAGDTRSPVVIAAIGVWVTRVPLVYLLTRVIPLGLAGVWITTVVDWCVRAALTAWVYRRGAWQRVRL